MKLVLDLATPEAELTWVVVVSQDSLPAKDGPISEITKQCHDRASKIVVRHRKQIIQSTKSAYLTLSLTLISAKRGFERCFCDGGPLTIPNGDGCPPISMYLRGDSIQPSVSRPWPSWPCQHGSTQ